VIYAAVTGNTMAAIDFFLLMCILGRVIN
jgi:hypothetical protein